MKPRDPLLDSVRHASCCGKDQYESLRDAEKGVADILKKKGDDGQPLYPYACVFCTFFHLGRRPKPSTLELLSDAARVGRYDVSSNCILCESDPRPRSLGRPAEVEGRRVKVRALVAALPDFIPSVGTVPHSPHWWRSLADKAGVRKPSRKTMAAVLSLANGVDSLTPPAEQKGHRSTK